MARLSIVAEGAGVVRNVKEEAVDGVDRKHQVQLMVVALSVLGVR